MFNLSVTTVSGIAVPKVRIDKAFDMSHQDVALLLFMIKNGSFYDLICDKLNKKLGKKDLQMIEDIFQGLNRISQTIAQVGDDSKELKAAMTPIVDAGKTGL